MTMVMLMFISGTSALLLSRYSSAGFLLVWPVLGDFVLPLCFVLLAQIFRNRICAVIAVLLAFASVILRITALIIRKETFMPLGMDSLQLLWEHADHNGLQAVFGRYYYFWMIPLAVLLVGAIIYFCARAWYASRNRRRIIPDSWITVFAVLFSASGKKVDRLFFLSLLTDKVVEKEALYPNKSSLLLKKYDIRRRCR